MSGLGPVGPVDPSTYPAPMGNPLEGYNLNAYKAAYYANGAAGTLSSPEFFGGDGSWNAAYAKFEKLYKEVTQASPPPPSQKLCNELIKAGNTLISIGKADLPNVQSGERSTAQSYLTSLENQMGKFAAWVQGGRKAS